MVTKVLLEEAAKNSTENLPDTSTLTTMQDVTCDGTSLAWTPDINMYGCTPTCKVSFHRALTTGYFMGIVSLAFTSLISPGAILQQAEHEQQLGESYISSVQGQVEVRQDPIGLLSCVTFHLPASHVRMAME